ncbi:MAG: phosphotransferase [bacterium]|nr:phosphotransferase [bacterium]
MDIDQNKLNIQKHLEKHFGLHNVVCENLNTSTNDIFLVTTPTDRFALKLYNPQSRTVADVQWELELIIHLIKNGVPVVKPISGKNGYVETFVVDGQDRAAVLFEWARGEKPKPTKDTYKLLGKAAAQIHQAATTFTSSLSRHNHKYDATKLIDEQLKRMEKHLIAAGKWPKMLELGERLKNIVANPVLDWGICHMDLTLDNVYRDGDTITVFDFDSAAKCWRALEPHKVLRLSKEYFEAWLEGYRSVRPFKKLDEETVATFGIIGDLRVVAWDLGVARSSRGTPKIGIPGLADIVDGWLDWENKYISNKS